MLTTVTVIIIIGRPSVKNLLRRESLMHLFPNHIWQINSYLEVPGDHYSDDNTGTLSSQSDFGFVSFPVSPFLVKKSCHMGFQKAVDLSFHSQQLEGKIQKLFDFRMLLAVLKRQNAGLPCD